MDHFGLKSIGAVLLSALSGVLPLQAEEGFSSTRPLKVLIEAPLSGDVAIFGGAVANGVRLAYADLAPEEQARVKLFFDDDQFSPTRSVSGYRKFRSTEDIDVMINAGSQTARALAPLAESEHVPFLAVASDPLVSEGLRYPMNFWVTPADEARMVLPELQDRGCKVIARVSAIHDFAVSVNKAFDELNGGRIRVGASEEYPMEVRDFRTFIAKARGLPQLDAIMVVLMPGQVGIFARQAREQGIKVPLFGYEFFESEAELKASQGALVGSWYVNAASGTPEFQKKYAEAFPGASGFGAANGYDALMLYVSAIKRAKNREEINNFLHAVKDDRGMSGKISADGNVFRLPGAIKVVRERGFEELKVIEN